jgi:hypothetical protein
MLTRSRATSSVFPKNSIAAHLVTRHFSTAVLTNNSIARLDNVLVGHYHDYVYPR